MIELLLGDLFMEKNTFYIGCHLSSSEGFLKMAKQIIDLHGNTFQFFTRNPRGGAVKPLDLNDINQFNIFSKENNLGYIVAHAPYTMNLCSENPSTRNFALGVLKDDLFRLNYVDHVYYNFHPGSHVGQGVEKGTDFIVNALNEVLKPEQKTIVLLETMAGKGSEIGRNFQEIKDIIDRVNLNDHLGVCLDTCHVHDGGYDLINNLDEVLNEFDRIIGLDKLKAIHINDSMNPLGAHKDRHQKIGQGYLGLETFIKIINHPKLKNLPFILETPNELEGYQQEIDLLKSHYQG